MALAVVMGALCLALNARWNGEPQQNQALTTQVCSFAHLEAPPKNDHSPNLTLWPAGRFGLQPMDWICGGGQTFPAAARLPILQGKLDTAPCQMLVWFSSTLTPHRMASASTATGASDTRTTTSVCVLHVKVCVSVVALV